MQRHKFIKREVQKGKEGILERIFQQKAVAVDELQEIDKWLFEEDSQCRIINIEFMRNFFGKHEKLFIERSKEYFGESIIYCNMNQTEAYVILRDKKYQKGQVLEGNLQNLIHRAALLNKDEVSVVVGKVVFSLGEFMAEAKRVRSVRLKVFGYNNGIVWLTEENNKNIMAIESVEQQFLLAADINDKELIRRFSKRLLHLVVESKLLSRLYTQNICYTMIHAVYEKNQINHAKIMKAVDTLFKTEELREMLIKFDQAFDEILDTLEDSDVDAKDVVRRIKEIIAKEDDMENLGLTIISKKLEMEPNYVSYLFKMTEKKTLMQYISDEKGRIY
ncbi:MAG: hypothetical protein ACI4F9_09230 [Lachnospiraceae bacterium]